MIRGESAFFMPVDSDSVYFKAEHEPQPLPEHVVISGPMGIGKGTIIERLRPWLYERDAERGIQRSWSQSWTTRPWRADDGMDAYKYVSEEQFEEAIRNNGFMEYNFHARAYYGTPVPPESLAMLYEVEVNGFANMVAWLHAHRPSEQVQGIFLLPKDAETLWDRLCSRQDGVGREKKFQRFQRFVTTELDKAIELPYHFIVNDNLDIATAETMAALNGTYFCRDSDDALELLSALREDGLKILQREATTID